MDKEQRRQKFLKEHPNFTYERLFGGIYGSVKHWKEKYPERSKAHKKVFVEIRAGRLKQVKCFCGIKNTQAHHPDYSKPLEVVWLCKKHHMEADKKRRILTK